eukprot:1830694-Lingulodinium_polyedra.AAC.1
MARGRPDIEPRVRRHVSKTFAVPERGRGNPRLGIGAYAPPLQGVLDWRFNGTSSVGRGRVPANAASSPNKSLRNSMPRAPSRT